MSDDIGEYSAGEQPAGPEGPAQPGAENLQARLQELQEENAALKDQLLRKAADFENFRKRMFREKEEGIRYANAALLTDLITIIDDFERAIQSAEDSKDFDSFHTGVTMIERQLVSMLDRNWGLKRLISVGEEFDPNRHQAITVEAVPGQQRPVVLEDYQRGYILHDRVLRPAKVKVAQPSPADVNGSNEKQPTDDANPSATEQDES